MLAKRQGHNLSAWWLVFPHSPFMEERGPKDRSDADVASINEPALPKERVPTGCTKAFDSLYFCYSPFHQGREYYITGQLDDCRGRLKRFRMCLMSRFRPQEVSETIYEEEEKKDSSGKSKAPPVWEFSDEYLANVRKAEQQERKETKMQREEEADGEAKWWL